MRFETAPGRQMQIDFGERLVEIGGNKIRAYLFVATLGYSRRHHVRAFRNERQESWFDGLERAFAKFGGVTEEVLFDNARALVVEHDPTTRTVVFNEKLKTFAKHGASGRGPARHTAPALRERENGVGYAKRNAIAGRSFPTWEAFEAHLDAWSREIADVRVHGTTGEAPIVRFQRDEAKALKSIAGIPPFHVARELIRRVQADCAVEINGNAYSVPWRLIGETVRATVMDGTCASTTAASRWQSSGVRQPPATVVDPAHFAGLAGLRPSYPRPGDLPSGQMAPALLAFARRI